MKTILRLIIGFIIAGPASAQNYTLNWTSSFGSGWANGATTGNAFNIGGSGINCSVAITKSGGVFASSSGISAPTVTYSLVQVPSSANNLMVALDYSNPSQYTDITFTFSTLVYDLGFNLADIDRLTNVSNSYYDRIKITGSIGVLSVNPTITKYDAITDPNFLSISSNIAQVNSASGMAGNTASDATDQKGTIKVYFGGQAINSFTIRYDNRASVAADPGVQFIGIGNINFYNGWPLSVELTSFGGQNANGKNTLNWKTTNEIELAYYAIERSTNGKNFNEIGKVESHNSTISTEYMFNDNMVSSESYYYRLKMVNTDGSFTYSKIVQVAFNDATEIKAFPTVFTSSFTIRTSSSKEEPIQLMVLDPSGKTVYQQTYKAKKGINEMAISLPASLGRGQYFVIIGNKNKSVSVIKQ